MSKALQVYDDGKLVDVPKEEVENITDMRRIFSGIQEIWYTAYEQKISEHNFTSGLLRFAIAFIKRRLEESGKSNDDWLNEKAGKIWDSHWTQDRQTGRRFRCSRLQREEGDG